MSDPKYITTPKPELVERIRADQYLDEAHQATFNTAVMNILSTKIAESAFAQIIDGFPLKDVAFGKTGHRNTIYDPIFKHTALCPGAMDKASQFRASITPKEMEMEVEVSMSMFSAQQLGWAFTENRDPQALHRFQSVPADSRASHLPLIELSARAVHRIAVLLFQLDDTYHKNEIHVGERPKSDTRLPPFPTPFTLSSYRFQEQYPDGVADLAGYWAEDEIFGGVVLFERVNTEEEYKDVWFHSHREDVTMRPYALTEEQKTNFVHFLRAAKPDDTLLPILGNENNCRRVDAEIAIPEHNIYRDRWERKIERYDYGHYLRMRRDVIDVLDYPETANRGFTEP